MLSRVNVATAVNILSSTSTSFGGAQQIDEKLQKQLLDEEEKAMSQFKVGKTTIGLDLEKNILDMQKWCNWKVTIMAILFTEEETWNNTIS